MQRQRGRVLQCSPGMALTLALLSLSLFSWGLRYKLSLYHTGSPHARMAAAKLLSQKERVGASHVRSTKIPPSHNTTLDGLSLISPVAWSDSFDLPERVASEERETSRSLFSTHTSSRPPPITAAL